MAAFPAQVDATIEPARSARERGEVQGSSKLKRRIVCAFFAALAVPTPFACGGQSQAQAPPVLRSKTAINGQALVGALRDGGYVIYFRHATTDLAKRDNYSAPNYLNNCSAQRDLNGEGEAQARAIGQAFQLLRIPVGEVLSSEYCRSRKTAELAFGKAHLTADLTSPFWDERYGGLTVEQKNKALRMYLSTPPPSGSNTVLVAHGENLSNASGLRLPTEGDAAVFRPESNGRSEFVVTVPPQGWVQLAQR